METIYRIKVKKLYLHLGVRTNLNAVFLGWMFFNWWAFKNRIDQKLHCLYVVFVLITTLN